jgi:MFS family permease
LSNADDRLMGRLTAPAAHLRASARVVGAVTRNPALRRVELAYLLFNSVEFGTWVAILLYAYGATGPASIGLVAVAQLVPAAIVAPAAALIADRPDRVGSLAIGYLIQTAAFGATALGMLVDAPPILVYVAAAAAAASLSITRPTQGALLPELSRTPEELTAANGLSGTVEGAGVFLGPLVAALILTVGGPGVVVAVGTVAIAAAALLVRSVGRVRTGPQEVTSSRSSDGIRATTPPGVDPGRRIMAGLRAVAMDRDVRLVVGVLGARSAVSGALDVLFVLLALEVFGTGDPGAAILNGALGLGMVIG